MAITPEEETVGVGSRPSDYLRLMKPRVMSLVVFTALIGALSAPGTPSLGLLTITVLAIALGGGSAGAFNMWIERERDALMARTRSRPLPQGRIPHEEALGFAVILAGVSVMILGLATNWLAAGLLAVTIGYYAVIYTVWLKSRTPQNIVIGGAAGAFPPVIGWMAFSGTPDPLPWILFAVIFLWTPPHFWALALFHQSDYEKAGIPMLPATHGRVATKRQIALYAASLIPLSGLSWWAGLSSALHGLVSALVSLGFFAGTIVLLLQQGQAELRMARRVFTYSLIHLFAWFALLPVL